MDFHINFISELSTAAALKMISTQTVPIYWDDAEDFQVLQDLAVAVFNKVCLFL